MAVFIGLLWLCCNVAGSHIWHLVALVAIYFGLVHAQLTEIAFKVWVILQTHDRILVFHYLLTAHVCVVVLVSVNLLVLLVGTALSSFWLVNLRLLLNHASFILVEWHWNLGTIIMICMHLVSWTATRHVLSGGYLTSRLRHDASVLLLMVYRKPAANINVALTYWTFATGDADGRRWHITDQVMPLSRGWPSRRLKIIRCLICLICLRGQTTFHLLILTIDSMSHDVAAVILLWIVV